MNYISADLFYQNSKEIWVTRSMDYFDEILNKPMYLFDFESQFTDLLDFIEFSEGNLEWQRRSHVQSLGRQAKKHNYDSNDYYAELQGIEYRFDINLPRKIRSSSIIAFATSIEWVAAFIDSHKTYAIKKEGKASNKSIHIIRKSILKLKKVLDKTINNNIDILEDIIKIRNCIAHNDGIVNGYRFQSDIEAIINRVKGFSISNEFFIDGSINIQKGAIEPIIKETQEWLLVFIEQCRNNGLIKL